LEESFERVRYWPQRKKKPIADMMTSVRKEPMAALDEAIKSAAGFRQLCVGGSALGRITTHAIKALRLA
jgi:hypothetical protein